MTASRSPNPHFDRASPPRDRSPRGFERSGLRRGDPLACVVGVYAALALAGLALTGLRGGWTAIAQLGPGHAPGASLESLLWGVLIAAVTLVATAPSLVHARWMRRIGRLVRRFFAPITVRRVTVIGLVSAVGEEALFRGGLQPFLGLTLTSGLFGALHVMPPWRRNWPWSVFALALGFGLGWVFERTGSLVGPTAAHAAINAANLYRCGRR